MKMEESKPVQGTQTCLTLLNLEVNMKIRIVTDTAADCLEQEIENWNIEVVNLPVTFDGELEPCQDVNLFWKTLMSGSTARTSQPSPDVFCQLFEDARKHNDALIYISISSKLSGTFANALAIKQQYGYDNVYVVDSLGATAAEKILVHEACKLRDEGVEASEIVAKLNELKHRVKLYACIDSLKYLARGGRISKTTATIGALINIKPLITLTDGQVVPYSKSIGSVLAMNKIVEVMKASNVDSSYAPVPMYSFDKKNALAFVKRANEHGLNIDDKYLTPIGATIGTHTGPGGFGIVFIESPSL